MSRLRKEKNCLNCGHHVEDIYCSHCGQKNLETHVNAFHAIAEFVGDYLHADGKFLKSISPLLFRPGYMTNEYNAGRREKFINPFRLYIFISIVYFSIAYLSNDSSESSSTNAKFTPRITLGNKGFITFGNNDSTGMQEDSTINLLETRAKKLPATIEAYRDSVSRLPSASRPSMSEDIKNRVAIKLNASGDRKSLMETTVEKFNHALPKFLFFLLPLAALLLKLFYIRRKRYYIDHLVHTLHLHSFIFLLLTINALIHLLTNSNIFFLIAVLFMTVYYFISLRRVYLQSRLKTIIKGILISVAYFFCLVFIFSAGFLFIFIYE